MINSISKSDKFNEYLVKAVSVHIGLVIFFILGDTLLNLDLFKFEAAKKEVKVIQSAVRVDIVGLPKMTLQELKKMNLIPLDNSLKEEPQGKLNETSDIEFKQTKKKINLSNLLKNLSSKKVKKAIKKRKTKKNIAIDKSVLRKLVLEGNKVSKGTSTVGAEIDLAAQEFTQYIQSLPGRIRPNWKLPSFLLEKDLRCRIRLFIASNGSILRMEIFESSGEDEYDKKAMEAVKKSSPLPKPTRDILAKVAGGDVILGFPL